MPKDAMTSRERVRAALRREAVDHLPLCVDTLCHGQVRYVSNRFPDPFERALYYQGLGLDTGTRIEAPLQAPSENPAVEFREWREQPPDEAWPLLCKEYRTARGALRQTVRLTPDYRQDVIADMFSDFNVPAARSVQYLVEQEADLDKLELLLRPLSGQALAEYREDAKRARRFCDEHQLTLAVYHLGVGDPLIWLSGVEGTLRFAMEEKAFCRRYVELIAAWQRQVLEIALEAGAQHVIRRGYYEGTDFWSPRLYEEFLLAPLQREAQIIHQAGATVAYVMASGYMPLLEPIKRSGVDMLTGLDPEARGTDIPAIRAAIGDAVTLCGGVNNYHVLDRGTPQEVRRAVQEAIAVFTPAAGCILAPTDAIGYDDVSGKNAAREEQNFQVMVETWREAVGA